MGRIPTKPNFRTMKHKNQSKISSKKAVFKGEISRFGKYKYNIYMERKHHKLFISEMEWLEVAKTGKCQGKKVIWDGEHYVFQKKNDIYQIVVIYPEKEELE